ncbi:MAG: FixH family protein [Rhizobiaceae bacterium]|nr:FixH family protein [Rhizobiaceae bacterium]
MSASQRVKSFNGRHMLAIMLGFFGVIITVNMTMAYFARASWTGLVVENSYVASQQFNAKMAETRAQEALGWTSALTLEGGKVRYNLTDRAGHSVSLKSVTLKFMHPVDDREDTVVEMVRGGDGIYEAFHPLNDGVWLAEISADAGLEKPYRELLRLQLERGSRL